MKPRCVAAAVLLLVAPALALDGQPGLHDPSTVIQADGKFYVYATGNGLPAFVSDDGWTWRRAGSLMQAVPGGRPGPDVIARGGNNSWAPDIIRVRRQVLPLLLRARARNPRRRSACWSARPSIPDRRTTSGRTAARSCGPTASRTATRSIPACFAIRRTDRSGSPTARTSATSASSNSIRKPASASTRIAKPVNIAINSEASIMIFHDGWYYLLVTHGSCCAGGEFQLQHPHGPIEEGDRPVPRQHGHRHDPGRREAVRSDPSGRHIGPGHFGLLDLGDGVQKFSCHYEADLDRGGASVLDIRPLLWRDGWPVAGENFKAGTYEIESARTGTALELAVQGVPVGGARGRGVAAARGRRAPASRAARRMRRGHADSGAGRRAGRRRTGRRHGRRAHGALHVPGAAEVDDRAGRRCRRLSRVAVLQDHDRRDRSRARGHRRTPSWWSCPHSPARPEQLWRIDQLTDGTYRVMPKAVPNSNEPLALSAVGSSIADARQIPP